VIHSTRILTRAIAGVAVALLIGPACSSDQSTATSKAAVSANRDALQIVFRTLEPPRSGANTVEVTVKQADGKPLTDATVTAEFRMPAMPSMNMPEMHTTVPLTHQGEGRYRGAGELVMSGTWNVTVAVARAGQPVATQRETVIAK
jgi:nitrogen fixation protein FixH